MTQILQGDRVNPCRFNLSLAEKSSVKIVVSAGHNRMLYVYLM